MTQMHQAHPAEGAGKFMDIYGTYYGCIPKKDVITAGTALQLDWTAP